MRFSVRVGLAVLALVLSGSSAWAQVCSGAPAISNASPFQAGGSVLFAKDTTGFAALMQGGNSNFFGGVQIGRVTTDTGPEDISSTLIGGRVGAQFTYETNWPVYVCPVFNVSRTSASEEIQGIDFGFSTTSLMFGADVGVVAAQSGNLQIIPTGGLYFGRASFSTEVDGDEIDCDECSETGGLVNLGVGLLFNERFSVTPLVTFPFGFGEASETSFSITALYSFGRR